jgi:hypothetical protein
VSDPAQVTTLTMRSGNDSHQQDAGRLSFYEPLFNAACGSDKPSR